jgi:ABC-type dipeptide/oligopeptide/nickel transport system permease component
VRGDFGTSIWTGQPALTEIGKALTLEMGLMAIVISLMVGLPIGVMSAMRRNTPVDYVGRVCNREKPELLLTSSG